MTDRSALGRFTYWAVSGVVEQLILMGPVDSVREGWHEAKCLLCEWETSGVEPVVDDAAHEHVSEVHKAEVEAEKVVLAAARAYCETRFSYDAGSYADADARERHIAADTYSHARGPAFRAAVKAALDAAAALAAPAPAPAAR